MKVIRPPQFADDRWYSSQPERLQQDIEAHLQGAPTPALPGSVIGLVAPHAGHIFSGPVAAAGFVQLRPGPIETVVLIGPDHHGQAPGAVSTVEVERWRTPLGEIPVDWGILAALQTEIELVLLAGDQEHSLEIELPFLQVVLGQFKLVPLMMGGQSLPLCRRLAAALVETLRRLQPNFLLVASSDLSHFFDDETARRLDQETLEFILNLDAAGLVRRVEQARRREQPLACGSGPIATIIEAAQAFGPTQAHLLKYGTSADVHPRKERVVGYAAVALTTGAG